MFAEKTGMGNQYKYLAKNTVIFAVSSFAPKLLAFLLIPLYTRVLSEAEYGTADLISTTSNLLIFVATICIADAVLRFAMDGKESGTGVFRYGLKVELIGLAITGVALAPVAVLNPFHWDPALYVYLFLTLCASALNQLIAGYLRAIDRVMAAAVMGILVTAVAAVCSLVLLLWAGMGLDGYLISFIAGYLVSSLFGFAAILRHDRECLLQICSEETRKRMVLYALPLILNGLAWWINGSLDRYFIIGFCGAAANGLYAAASKVPTILASVSQVFSQAWNLSAIREYDREDKTGFFRNIYALYNFILVAGCSLLVLINIPLAGILFGRDFFPAWEYASVLTVSAVFSALSGFLGGIFAAVRNSKAFAVSTVAGAVLNALLNAVLVPTYGALGAAMATAGSFFCVWLIRYLCTARYIKLNVNLVRDLAVYGMLVLQVVLEHAGDHYYVLQGCVFILILLLYRKELKTVLQKAGRIFGRTRGA